MATPAAPRVDIPVAHGRLEGLLSEAVGAFAAVAVCHPHPLFGGSLDNPVAFRIARALGDAGATVLRFNFRGVGRSTGRHGKGLDEQEDVSAALDFLQATSSVPLWVAGYSFGAWVGLSVGAREPRVKRLLGVEMFDHSALDGCEKRRPLPEPPMTPVIALQQPDPDREASAVLSAEADRHTGRIPAALESHASRAPLRETRAGAGSLLPE